ncbi:MAG TPA: hypothetical protein VFU03_09840 [Gemmatimonadales bacterium]|nr:hypothetical protein [Gemmatimonadales bacterium]
MKVIAALLPIVALLALPASVSAQAAPIRYRTADLACARFRQSVETSLRVESGNRVLRQSSGRSGLLVVTARDTAGGILIESWFDSLMVWRAELTGKHLVDTDGVIGGRFIGLLKPEGRYSRIDAPFVPDEIAEITNLTAALDDFFSPVPGTSLDVGQRWQDSTGWIISRQSDQKNLQRYRMLGNRTLHSRLGGDSLADTAQQVERETALMLWDPAAGLTRWDRSIEAEASIPASDEVPHGAQTRVEQTIRLERVSGGECPP